jgi:hypothetical protein
MKFGTGRHKLVRTHDPETSHQAAGHVKTKGLEEMVYEDIKSFGPDGCISDEIRAMHPGTPYSSITARYKALKDKEYIVDTGMRRAGVSGKNQRVLRAA